LWRQQRKQISFTVCVLRLVHFVVVGVLIHVSKVLPDPSYKTNFSGKKASISGDISNMPATSGAMSGNTRVSTQL
jgi:hypothetical protein